jgi:glucose/arabinose dehydrogenase
LETFDYIVAVDAWAEGLDIPWGIAFTGTDDALVTERPGRLRVIKDGKLLPDPVSGTPNVWRRSQGGLLDVAVDPEYAENGWVYLSYSHPRQNGAMTRIIRGKIVENKWSEEKVLFEAAEDTYTPAGVHFGSRIVFPPDGFLYFSIGERGVPALAQDLSRPNGKVFRIHRDGRIPDDNPFVGQENALPQIFSYGHRNPQGLAVHPVTGDVWETEHGPRGGDELNIIRKGANYGWPEITYGINYNGTVISRERVRPGMEQPIWIWRPSTGTCGLDWYTGTEFPYWNNHLLAGGLASRDLRLLKIENDRVLHEEILLKGRRTRDVQTGPDGAIYVLVEEPGEVLRLTRVEERKY